MLPISCKRFFVNSSVFVSRFFYQLKSHLPYFFYFFPAYVVSLMLCARNIYKNCWLIAEREDEARDNAYHFLHYLNKEKKQLKAFYVIRESAADAKKVKLCGPLIEPASFQHFIALFLSDAIISTHGYGAAPNGNAVKPFLTFLKKVEIVNLKHGVVHNKRVYNMPREGVISCVSDKEIGYFNGSNKNTLSSLKVTGLCRYDSLYDTSGQQKKKIILIMPTFRKWLEDYSRVKNRDQLFVSDKYYSNIISLLRNDKLISLCHDAGYEIFFYPHYRIHKYLHLFQTSDQVVKILSGSDADIQEIMKKASLMVTD